MRVYKKDNMNRIRTTRVEKEEIEKAITKQNKSYFTKACESEAHQDKTYSKL